MAPDLIAATAVAILPYPVKSKDLVFGLIFCISLIIDNEPNPESKTAIFANKLF